MWCSRRHHHRPTRTAGDERFFSESKQSDKNDPTNGSQQALRPWATTICHAGNVGRRFSLSVILPVRAHPPRATSPARPARPRSVAPDDGGVARDRRRVPPARARFARAGSRASSATSPVGACSASLARAVAAPGRATPPPRPADAPPARLRGGGRRGAGAAQGGEQESALAFEPKSKSSKRRDGSKTRRAKITVEGPPSKRRGEATPTIQSASEEAYILFLFAYVVVIFLGGLVLAVSAFGILPDKLDSWVTETLYPSYSPIVIGFLVFSSIYGLVKTRDDPNSAVGK